MKYWEQFEINTQVILAPLLHNTTQKDLFRATNKSHERMFLDIVTRLLKPTHFLQIGAYEAATAQKVARTLPGTIATAFEADPDVHAHFSASLKDPPANFHYVPSAVSAEDGEVPFRKQSKISGLPADTLSPNNSILEKRRDIEYNSVTVPSVRLDTYAAKLGPISTAVLQIDVEGMLHQVIEGAEGVLRRAVAIYAEVEDYEIWRGQNTVFDVYPILEDAGFVPVSRDVQSPGQYNVLWLRRDLCFERPLRARLALYNIELQRIVQTSLARHPSR